MRAAAAVLAVATASALAASEGPIRTVIYDPTKVIHVSVARGVPAHVEFESGEEIISDIATGLASVCRSAARGSTEAADTDSASDAWDLCAPKNGRDLWIKPVGAGRLSNPVALRTNRRAYSFSFDVVTNPALAVQRLSILSPSAPPPSPEAAALAQRAAMAAALEPQPEEIVAARLAALPTVRNSAYEIRTNEAGSEARPNVIFDDGRFTYFQFRGNRSLPSIHRINADGTRQQVNPRLDSRMGRLLVADQVAPGWELRLGAEKDSPVAEIVNRAYDPEGVPPEEGSAAEGVVRVLRAPGPSARRD